VLLIGQALESLERRRITYVNYLELLLVRFVLAYCTSLCSPCYNVDDDILHLLQFVSMFGLLVAWTCPLQSEKCGCLLKEFF
jgi:hypothetical protein